MALGTGLRTRIDLNHLPCLDQVRIPAKMNQGKSWQALGMRVSSMVMAPRRVDKQDIVLSKNRERRLVRSNLSGLERLEDALAVRSCGFRARRRHLWQLVENSIATSAVQPRPNDRNPHTNFADEYFRSR